MLGIISRNVVDKREWVISSLFVKVMMYAKLLMNIMLRLVGTTYLRKDIDMLGTTA